MDYSNFVKNFYRCATNELKKRENYYGRIVNINKPLEVPSEFLHAEGNPSLFMPQETVNIDAPTKHFIDFMDYYVQLMPDLGVVFASKKRINDLYKAAGEMGILEDDEKTSKYIEFVIGVGVKTLEGQGIL